MVEQGDVGTRTQVLDLIVEKGPVTASAIARQLGLTTAAVRRHITTLEESGEIIEHEPGLVGKRGRGRPARHYVAGQEAHHLLPEGYSELAVKALGYLGQVGGGEAVESFAAARSREIERRYAPVVREA
ncbi:helix-turn-helix transcriptional regulator, partial [Actinomyces polynesiensis]|uniref:helix-turn-helix transcriptional regulator n=1 Tax=Actinomyces polynesiensis TaxID=1325934 RepID=UPI0005B82F56